MFNMGESENIRAGDLKTIEGICSSTWESLYRYIYYKVQNREEAEDITQETYVRAIPYLQKKRISPDRYIGFLRTVSLNIIRDRWRMVKRHGTNVNFDEVNPEETSHDDPSEASIQRSLIENALNSLNKDQSTVIKLRILKGYSVAETAKIMNRKETSIRVLQHRALQALASILKDNH